MKQRDLTKGSITGNLMLFALPLMAGNLLQQCYNIADTLIVGRYLGANALAAVGSSYTLMTFLTSILIGMCMGSGAVFSIRFGEQDHKKLKEGILHSFGLIAAMTVVINVLVYAGLPLILKVLQVPAEVVPYMRTYLLVIFAGISATFLYNYFAALLRAVGNSVVPLIFLAVSTVLNIVLDLLFVLGFGLCPGPGCRVEAFALHGQPACRELGCSLVANTFDALNQVSPVFELALLAFGQDPLGQARANAIDAVQVCLGGLVHIHGSKGRGSKKESDAEKEFFEHGDRPEKRN